MANNRRNVLKTAVAAMAGASAAQAQSGPTKKVHYMDGKKPAKTPLFSSAVSYGNLLFLSGVGAHVPGDIKKHTDIVLTELERQLKNAGSSMEKVLKVSVFLNDIKDWPAMNEVFQGRFGSEPPVRTTVAPAGGIPGNSL
ncbi:MAG TPA: RidA family protein, partial [Bryobacteraceae bacterium]